MADTRYELTAAGITLVLGNQFTFKEKFRTPEHLVEFIRFTIVDNTKGNRLRLDRITRKHGINGLSVKVSNRGNVSFRTRGMVASMDDAMKLVMAFKAAADRIHARRRRAELSEHRNDGRRAFSEQAAANARTVQFMERHGGFAVPVS